MRVKVPYRPFWSELLAQGKGVVARQGLKEAGVKDVGPSLRCYGTCWRPDNGATGSLPITALVVRPGFLVPPAPGEKLDGDLIEGLRFAPSAPCPYPPQHEKNLYLLRRSDSRLRPVRGQSLENVILWSAGMSRGPLPIRRRPASRGLRCDDSGRPRLQPRNIF
jgi:hypothetical protein